MPAATISTQTGRNHETTGDSGAARIVEVPSLPADPDNVSRDDLVFPERTMHLVSTTVGASFTVNPRNCLFKLTLQQTGEISGGTGQFADATGSGTGTVSGQALFPATPTAAAPSRNHRSTRRT